MSGECDACVAAGSTVYDCQTLHSGIEERVGDMDVYTVGEGTTAVILGYDIFGFKIANARSNCDTLASAASNFKEFTIDAIKQLIQDCGQYQQVKRDLQEHILPYLSGKGVTKFLWIGFCWGGKIALDIAADEGLGPSFKACGGVHAALKEPEEMVCQKALATNCPLMFLQAVNDADVRPLAEALDTTALKEKHMVRTFYDMQHGWCGARGDRSIPKIAAAVKATLQMSLDFFHESLS
eukprot:gene3559-4486_t